MGKTAKSKMVVKQCPKCERHMPVACKQCKCGHEFFSKRLVQLPSEDAGDEDGNGVKRRRTERVKRERPDYYRANEYENHLRRLKEKDEKSRKKKKKHRRGRPKGSQNKSADQIEEEREKDLYSNLPKDKAFIYAVVLAEINERMLNQAWKPPPVPSPGPGPALGPDVPSSSGVSLSRKKGTSKT